MDRCYKTRKQIKEKKHKESGRKKERKQIKKREGKEIERETNQRNRKKKSEPSSALPRPNIPRFWVITFSHFSFYSLLILSLPSSSFRRTLGRLCSKSTHQTHTYMILLAISSGAIERTCQRMSAAESAKEAISAEQKNEFAEWMIKLTSNWHGTLWFMLWFPSLSTQSATLADSPQSPSLFYSTLPKTQSLHHEQAYNFKSFFFFLKKDETRLLEKSKPVRGTKTPKSQPQTPFESNAISKYQFQLIF